jgi:Tol biopolymer transport system component
MPATGDAPSALILGAGSPSVRPPPTREHAMDRTEDRGGVTRRLALLGSLLALLVAGLPAAAEARDAGLRLPDALPGDRLLLMEATAEGNALWSIELDGTDRQQLTSDEGDFAARWSPDGTRIAFHRGGAEATEPWIAAADGGSQRRLGEAGFSPAWSPDGLHVVFATAFAGSPGPLRVAPVETPASPADVPGTEGAIDPAWSPDGARIAFARSPEVAPQQTVGVVGVDGSGLRDIVLDELTGSPVWAPDGSRMAFAGAPAGQPYGLYTASREGGDLRRIAGALGGSPLEAIGAIAWSPDGTRLAFSADAPDGSARDLHLVGRDGGDVIRPTPSAADDRVGGWTADGEAIVFTRATEDASVMSGRDVRQVRLDEAPATRTVTTTGRSVASDVGPGRSLRVAGPDRIATAVRLSGLRAAADAVVVARADAYPDALAGAPLAAALDAPVLLTGGDGLDGRVAEEVRRLGATTAYVLGGTAALSPAVDDDLRAAGVATVERRAGGDRYGTAAAIARDVLDRTGAGRVYVVEGANEDPARGWPDAVAVSGLAALEGRPILLVTQPALPPATREALESLPVDAATVVGGTGAVSAAVESAVADTGVAVDRVAGASRYATSAALAARADAAGADAARPWLATGRNWPDALAAGAAVAADGGVLLLIDGEAFAGSPATRDRLAEVDVDRAVVVGGAGVVRPEARAAVEGVLAGGEGSSDDVEVSVFLSREDREPGDVVAVPRTVQGPAVLARAIAALLEGPTAAEQDEGFWSWFSEDTAGMLRSARVEDGTAHLDFDDFRDIIPNASTAAGSAALLGEIEATALQFDSVDAVRCAFLGDEEAFYAWLQRSPPE